MKKDHAPPDKEEAPRGVVRGFSTARRTRSARVAFNCNDRVSEAAVWRCGRTHTPKQKAPPESRRGEDTARTMGTIGLRWQRGKHRRHELDNEKGPANAAGPLLPWRRGGKGEMRQNLSVEPFHEKPVPKRKGPGRVRGCQGQQGMIDDRQQHYRKTDLAHLLEPATLLLLQSLRVQSFSQLHPSLGEPHELFCESRG
jgi:hypothetical protein